MKRCFGVFMVFAAVACSAAALQSVSPPSGACVPLQTPGQKKFLAMDEAAWRAGFTNEEWRAAARDEAGWCPAKVNFAWTGDPDEKEGFSLSVRRLPDGKAFAELKTRNREVSLDNFELGTEYEWIVAGRSGIAVTNRFVTEAATPRFIRIDGVPNVRDIGGRYGLGGRRIRQGMIIRSAGLNSNANSYYSRDEILAMFREGRLVSSVPGESREAAEKIAERLAANDEDGADLAHLVKEWKPGQDRMTGETREYAVRQFGIRTDLDLRTARECYGMKGSPFGDGVRWALAPGRAYAAIHSAEGRKAFAEDFRVFLDRANYPIVFHCIAGADRTGTLCYVLLSLLGVDEAEIMRDWAITAFYNKNLRFAPEARYDKLVESFASFPGATARERVEAYVRSVGFTDGDIETFRKIMLEEPVPASGIPELRLAIFSDPHIDGVARQAKVKRLFEFARDRDVDGVLIPGDLANDGRDSQLALLADAWFEVFPGSRNARGEKVEIIGCYGNRDFRESSVTREEEKIREAAVSIYAHPNESWEKLFHEPIGDDFCVRSVKGFPVLVVHWRHEKDIETHWPELSRGLEKDKPFFYMQHPHPIGTVFGGRIGDKGAATKILSRFPNAIAVSGHSHRSLSDERAFWHGSFISIGCGSGAIATPFMDLPYENIGNFAAIDHAPPRKPHMDITVSPKAESQVMILTLYKDRMDVERFDIGLGVPAGPTWRVPRPFRGNPAQPYGAVGRPEVPQFNAGAVAEVSRLDGKNRAGEAERQVVVSFPPAQPDSVSSGRVLEYEVAVLTPGGAEAAKEYVLSDNYFSPCVRPKKIVKCAFAEKDVPKGATFRVTPRNFLHEPGRPLTVVCP